MSGEEVRSILLDNGFVLADVAAKIGITAQTLNSRLNAKTFKEEYVKEISRVLKFDIQKKKDVDKNITYLLPLSAMGGSLTGFSESGTTLQNCEAIVSPIDNVDFAITVYGESMAPEYPSGSRILIKKINPDIFIDWGRVYVLDTSNGVVVKEVHESERAGYISCFSINQDPKFKPFDIPMDEVYGMYRVLMCMSSK